MLFKSVILALAASQLVAGHGAIIKAVGDAGGSGQAIGIDNSTPRDGTKRDPFQQDSTRFKNAAADACGETLAGGTNDPATQVPQMLAVDGNSMPQITPGGSVDMTLHQVNGDGAGPYECMIDSTGAGTQWAPMTVTQNVPGTNSRSQAKAQDFPLSAKVAANQTCTGSMAGMEGVCMVRCNNAARAGPFGGCVPVQMAGAGGNATAAAVPAAGAATTKKTARSFMA